MKRAPTWRAAARPAVARPAVARPAAPTARQRRRRRRHPWIFGGGAPWPYVFNQEPPAPDPDAAAAAAAAAASSVPDAVGDPPDAAPADAPPDAAAGAEPELGDRTPPRRPPPPRVIPGAKVTIAWHEEPLDAFPFPVATPGGGVYVVFDSTGPIYVGEADDFKVRWHKRLQAGYQAGVIGKDLKGHGIKVWFGTVTPTATEKGRQALESSLIRVLINGGFGARLRNDKQFNPIKPSTPIDIQNALPTGFAHRLAPVAKLSTTARAAVENARDHNHLTLVADSVFEVR
jgi:hypothetical protein